MTSSIGKIVAKKLLIGRFAPVDPYYETYTDDRGKKQTRKRPLPPGLSKRDAAILQSVRRRAHRLDEGFRICGLRFGWTFIVGIIPVVGDAADLILGYFLVVKKAKKADIPASLVREMVAHNVISTGIGMVPALGDICVAIYKPNSRNAVLLEEFLRLRGEEALKLNPVEDEKSARSKDSEKGRTWFRRSQKKAGQMNSVSASSTSTPSGAGAAERKNNLMVDGSSTPEISSSSKRR